MKEDTISVPERSDQVHDDHHSFVTLMALHRTVGSKDQRIVVAGDADFISNMRAMQHRFGRVLYSWLANGEYPISFPDSPQQDILLTITGRHCSTSEIVFCMDLTCTGTPGRQYIIDQA